MGWMSVPSEILNNLSSNLIIVRSLLKQKTKEAIMNSTVNARTGDCKLDRLQYCRVVFVGDAWPCSTVQYTVNTLVQYTRSQYCTYSLQCITTAYCSGMYKNYSRIDVRTTYVQYWTLSERFSLENSGKSPGEVLLESPSYKCSYLGLIL